MDIPEGMMFRRPTIEVDESIQHLDPSPRVSTMYRASCRNCGWIAIAVPNADFRNAFTVMVDEYNNHDCSGAVNE